MFKNLKLAVAGLVAVTLLGLPVVAFAGLPLLAAPPVGSAVLALTLAWQD